jgi:DNA-directed RNA polymerase III subunit RPC3
MTTQKEARKVIDRLLDKGYVQSQECPRTADRVSSRSQFLWYVDWTKAYQNIRVRILQELGNIATRKAHEREKHGIVLAKSQKQAVMENRSLMDDAEWKELEHLHAKLEYLRTGELRALQDLEILGLPEQRTDDLLAV